MADTKADKTAARRWAHALVELAVEAGAEAAILNDVEQILEAVESDDARLLQVLASPVFEIGERKGVLEQVVRRVGVQPLTGSFLSLLLDRGRVGLLPDVVRIFRDRMDERAGRLRVEVRTVEPLSPELTDELRGTFERATGKQVVIDPKLDPALIGGLVARIGGKVYDASLRTRLQDLRHRLTHAQVLPEA